MTPKNPDYAAACRAVFDRQPAMLSLGARLEAVEPGRCDIGLSWRAEHTQQNGYFHAGIVSSIADNAGGLAALSLLPPGSDVLTVEFKINLMSPADADRLVARGRVVKSGRTLSVCTVEVDAHKGDRITTCAVMQQTVFNVPAR